MDNNTFAWCGSSIADILESDGDIFLKVTCLPYFDVMVERAWGDDPESYAGSSVEIGRVSYARQVKVMTQTERNILVLQVGGWAWGWQPQPIKNMFFWIASKIQSQMFEGNFGRG